MKSSSGLIQKLLFLVLMIYLFIPVRVLSQRQLPISELKAQITALQFRADDTFTINQGLNPENFHKNSYQITSDLTLMLLPKNISFMENALWGKNGLFRKVGIASVLSIKSRKSELSLRRTMLSIHPVSGFVTLDMMIYTTYIGQKVLDGRENLSSKLNTFSNITIGLYSFTGLLSILSPPPLIRRNEFSTITVHKTLAWVHFACTILSPIIADIMENNNNKNFVKHYRQIARYIGTAALATSFVILTF